MPEYNAVFTWHYTVEANDEAEAEEKASDLAFEEFGKHFAKNAGLLIEEL